MVQVWRQWCRLCAREDSNDTHVSVFLKHEDASRFSDIINKCFSVNINPQDDWPQTICSRCHQLVTTIVTFTQTANRVQAMFAELFNSLEEMDASQLKAQYELHELGDVELDLKLFANSPEVQLFESKPSITMDNDDKIIDLEELEYINDEILTPRIIKTEGIDTDSPDEHEKEWADQQETADNGSDEYNSPKSEAEYADSLNEPKKKRPGRPKKCTYPKRKKETVKKFTCNECQKSFTRYPNYHNHIKAGHRTTAEAPQNSFNECDKKLTKALVGKTHIRTDHMDEKPFICEECGKTYKTLGTLNEHKLTHTEEMPFKCTWCEKQFKMKQRLKIHEDTHNETKYICTTCGLRLNTRRTLRMHMVVHSDQKHHKCNFCGKEYKRAKALKNHLILHTGLKPYTCNFCEKIFANGSNCRSHKKKTHPIELAAMEAAGTKSVTTNIPKLEQLRAVTSIKTVSLQSTECDQAFSDGFSVVSVAEDLESFRE